MLRNKVIPPTKHEIASAVRKYNENIAKVLNNLMRNERISKEKMIEYLRICEEIVSL